MVQVVDGRFKLASKQKKVREKEKIAGRFICWYVVFHLSRSWLVLC